MSGCDSNPYCLNCSIDDGGKVHYDLAGLDLAHPVDGGMADLTSDGGARDLMPFGDGGCNIPASQLQIDPFNCGMCGHECVYAHAAGLCMNGQCSMGMCQPGFIDFNNDPSDGCEYQCTPTGMKVCNNMDNFCDKVINEGFDLMTDVNNCGACGNVCAAPNSTASCVGGQCQFTCNAGYNNLTGIPSMGCTYQCPQWPTMPETCNGKDDDCNGLIDDNPTDVGKPCSSSCPTPASCVASNTCSYPLSTCTNGCCGICTAGMTACGGGQIICSPGAGPQIEVCDNVDNNCDGQIDEGYNFATDPLNCGGCNMVCTVKNAIAGCAAGKCTVVACQPGFADLNKDPSDGCEYTCPVYPPRSESCNGKDDDCNGATDDNLTQPSNFCVQTGICSSARPVCCGTSGWLCNYPSVSATIEVTNVVTQCQGGQSGASLSLTEALCDNIDGNCNGLTDETFTNKNKTCTTGVGACQGSGTFVCSANHLSTTCNATANALAATDELCNGIDDDCDGQTDERTPVANTQCYTGGVSSTKHTCKGWTDAMVKVGSTYIYQYEASHPGADGSNIGSNTTRACSVKGVLPWTTVNEASAAAACAAIKDSLGVPMRLCGTTSSDAEWVAACTAGSSANPIYAYVSNPTQYSGTTCNDFDKGLGKPWTTGFNEAACAAKNTAGNVADMSGNVQEWTAMQVVVNGVTYYQVHGGAYDSYGPATSCNFNFTIEQPTFESPNLGFRCCSTNAP